MTPPKHSGTRSVRALAVIAAPTLTLSLMAGSASAAGAGTYFVGENTGGGAVVASSSGVSHGLVSLLRAVSADGSVNALSAHVTPSRTATVIVDGTTGIGRMVKVDPADGDTQIYAGDGAVLARTGDSFVTIDPVTGTRTALANVPASTDGTKRTVMAVNAIAGGALVATADVTQAGTSGQVRSSQIWRLSSEGAQQLVSLSDQYVVAVAARPGGIDAVLVSVADDAMSHLSKGTGASVVQPMGLVVTPDVSAVDLGYADTGGALAPVVTVVSGEETVLYDSGGAQLNRYGAGRRVFVSAADLHDPQSVSNRLSTHAELSGVRDGSVLRYGAKVTPVASATAWSAEVAASEAPATLTVSNDKRTVAGTSGKRVVLTRNTCFTASSSATLYTQAATPATACVEVAHQLVLDSFNVHKRVAVVDTTADQLLVQVQKRGRWRTVSRVRVESHRAVVHAPSGKVRVVAAGSDENAAATLLVTDV